MAGVLRRQCAQHRRREGGRLPHRRCKLFVSAILFRTADGAPVPAEQSEANERGVRTWNDAGGELVAGAGRGRGAGEHPQHQGGAAGAVGGGRRRARRRGAPCRRRGDHGARMNASLPGLLVLGRALPRCRQVNLSVVFVDSVASPAASKRAENNGVRSSVGVACLLVIHRGWP